MAIKAMTNSLRWLSDLLAFFQVEAIKIPTKYRDRVLETKKLLQSDTSGLVNTVLDFAVDCALVDYTVETNNPNLTQVLNNWLENINSDLIGKIPTGIEALAKEYFNERWKASSHLLARTFWNKKDDLELPTLMFFLDGEDIKTKNGEDKKVLLGKEKYYIRISADEKDDIKLPREKNELIFVQRPYENWGVLEPIPFIIRRGLYRNLHFMTLMSQKGEYVIKKALEYMFVIKKGTEKLAIEGRADMIYSEEDLRKVKDDFGQLLKDKKTNVGTPVHATNFDTELEHLIPDYKKVMDEAIYVPIERRLLAGLGLIDIITGTASTRREAILNPKPFITEVKQGVKDFKSLLTDIMKIIVEKNDKDHRKWMNVKIKIKSSPIQEFVDDKFRAMIRSSYDRGRISSRTFVEIGLNMDYDLEVQRRLDEKKKGYDKTMYPPVIQNLEQQPDEFEKTPDDKKSIEKKNFMQSMHLLEEVTCPYCSGNFDYESQLEIDSLAVQCPECDKIIYFGDIEEVKLFEEAPYKTNQQLPKNIQGLPAGAKSIWRKAFNATYKKYGENRARKIAWSVVKKVFKKVGDRWVRKSKGSINTDELIQSCINSEETEIE